MGVLYCLVQLANVVQLQSGVSRINGRLTNVWSLILTDGNTRAFKQKDFTIYRVEISGGLTP